MIPAPNPLMKESEVSGYLAQALSFSNRFPCSRETTRYYLGGAKLLGSELARRYVIEL
jgi:hypothetical protein